MTTNRDPEQGQQSQRDGGTTDARDLAGAAAGTEEPTAAAEIVILHFQPDLVAQAAQLRQHRRYRGARTYSRSVMSSPS